MLAGRDDEPMHTKVVRRRFVVRGTVQGVGFRPFVHALATRLGLVGSVLNDGRGVVIEVQGDEDAIGDFGRRLTDDAPPLAAVVSVVAEQLPTGELEGFVIEASASTGPTSVAVPSDIATCDACLAELTDPSDRRFGYPFINCTNCGPRFTIITAMPYDRPNTTMTSFEMCGVCQAEYSDPSDRRFHAQPIACADCGPRPALVRSGGGSVDASALAEATRVIRSGGVVAVKGLGGYHLACDATNEVAVAELRRRKHREEKPLAVMVASIEEATKLAVPSGEEVEVLTSDRRPIVLVEKREGSPLASSISPGDRYVGLMLAYTPLHHLLLSEAGTPLVMTSANHADEPIVYKEAEARRLLDDVADAVLSHDRPIRMRCDDSVVRVVDGRLYPIRRSRGLAPAPIYVDPPFKFPVLGAGAQLKHTFCLGNDDSAVVSQHIGDLQTYEAMEAFQDALVHFRTIFGIQPEVVAHDLHPDYLSTKWALEQPDVRTVSVQHHHAHLASCLVDNGRSERVIGLVLDGTGLGDDDTLWGCEVLVGDLAGYTRQGHLAYVPVPGGEAAIREPWRMAAVYLDRIFGNGAIDLQLDVVKQTAASWGPILKMASTGINSPLASSAGRLFDAVAAICCGRLRVAFEGQAAAALEQLADPSVTEGYPCRVHETAIQGDELVAAVVEDLLSGVSAAVVAARFHNGLAGALLDLSRRARAAHGVTTVALSGGSFQNLLLLTRSREYLETDGFEVLVHRQIPPNDGGISLGQAVVANARLGSDGGL